MLKDLILIQRERKAAIIAITAYLFILLSTYQAEAQVIAEEKKEKAKNPIGNSAQTAAIGSVLLLLNIIILAQVAFRRLNEKQEKLMKGEKTDSIIPNINISTGYAIGVLGNTLRALGSLQRASEAGSQITIL
jgi:carbon starvation protein CstA